MNNTLNTAFTLLMLGWLLVGLLLLLFKSAGRTEFGSKFLAMTPSMLPTFGILGTFVGILVGLQGFNPTADNLPDSVGVLLNGMKTAFLTSVVGMAAAILFRFLRAMVPSGAGTEGVAPEDIHKVLLGIRDDARQAVTLTAELLVNLRKSISSDGDGSLLTQMQKLRTAMQDGQGELTREFREFAKHMVENNQKAIVEALEEVIRDFNNNLTEQFGENFKQLNEAVHSLVDWQENYRLHIEAVEGRLDLAATSLEGTQRALETVQTYSEKIPEAIKPLESVLKGIDAQTQVLAAHLGAIAAMHDKALAAFPVIDSNLEMLTTNFAASVKDTLAQTKAALQESKNAHSELKSGYDAFLSSSASARDQFETEFAKVMKQMSEQSSLGFVRHGELIEAAAKEAQKVINESWAESVTKMNGQFETFDQQMQQELGRALELLGRNLASVSEKFVNDYAPLTDRLREVVNLARSADK